MARRRRPRDSWLSPKAPVPMEEAVTEWIDRSGLQKRLELAEAVTNWPQAVGQQVRSVTRAEAVTPDGTLVVRVASAAWANELALMAPTILARINGSRRGRVRGIRWLVGPIDQP